MQYRLIALIAWLFAGVATSAQANVILTAVESGGDVVISGGGTLDLGGWGDEIDTTLDTGSVAASSVFVLGGLGTVFVNSWRDEPASFTGPTNIGPGSFLFSADDGSGDRFGLVFSGGLIVPDGYASGNPLNSSSTYTGRTLAFMGIEVGDYTWSWGSAEGQSITLNVVPEPSTAALMTLGLFGLAWRGRARPSQPAPEWLLAIFRELGFR